MIQVLYDFPLPNNGERYDLSQDELNDLLYKAYRNGFEHARDIYDPARQPVVTRSASYQDEAWKNITLND